MKKQLLFFVVFLLFQVCGISAQSLGFAETECGIVPNTNYYYENYQVMSHGAGYKLYHNGVIIKTEEGGIGGYTVEQLKFIDDTTGFFIVNNAYAKYYVYKICGESVIPVGEDSSMFCTSFIVNSFNIYVCSFPMQNYDFVRINGYSIFHSSKLLVYDSILLSDIIVTDTIKGLPLCPDLAEINFMYKHVNDTIVYTVQFIVVDSAVSVNENKISKTRIFPDPVNEFVNLDNAGLPEDIQLNIYNNAGLLKKSIKLKTGAGRKIFVGDLEKGLYLLEILNGKKRQSEKFIKN